MQHLGVSFFPSSRTQLLGVIKHDSDLQYLHTKDLWDIVKWDLAYDHELYIETIMCQQRVAAVRKDKVLKRIQNFIYKEDNQR